MPLLLSERQIGRVRLPDIPHPVRMPRMSELPSPGSELLDALYGGDRETVDRLLAEQPGLTIFEAAAVGDLARVHELLLLEAGFVDLFSPDGFTALHLAAFFGHEDVVAELVRRGADVSAVARNALGVEPLHSAAAGGHIAAARILLAHGADPNARQEGGFRPIHAAAQNGNDELYGLLVEHGADQEAATDDGRTVADFRP
jgi:ankyrin repeat protein